MLLSVTKDELEQIIASLELCHNKLARELWGRVVDPSHRVAPETLEFASDPDDEDPEEELVEDPSLTDEEDPEYDGLPEGAHGVDDIPF